MTLTIVSGAAPGVEQGAIEAAVNLALHWQGWASEQSILAVPPIYRTGLQPTSATDPGMIRRLNIQGCDGALVFSTSMVLAGVPAFVDRWTERMGRAFLHVTLNPAALRARLPAEVVVRVRDWLRDLPSGRVYVTGPSADDVPGIQGAVRDALLVILEPFAVEEVRQTTRALEALVRETSPLGRYQRTAPLRHDPHPDPVCGVGSTHHTHRCERPAGHAGVHVGRGCSWGEDAVDPGPTDCRGDPLDIGPPEGLDDAQRAKLDASIREAERDIRDEPPAPGGQTT